MEYIAGKTSIVSRGEFTAATGNDSYRDDLADRGGWIDAGNRTLQGTSCRFTNLFTVFHGSASTIRLSRRTIAFSRGRCNPANGKIGDPDAQTHTSRESRFLFERKFRVRLECGSIFRSLSKARRFCQFPP